MSSVRVLCVDDNEDILGALQQYFAGSDDFEVIGALQSTSELEAAVRDQRPDILVLDLDMPGQSPLVALRKINDSGAATRTVVFSGQVRSELVGKAMDAGTWGYVSKNDGVGDLVTAIRGVLIGEVGWSPEVRAVILQR